MFDYLSKFQNLSKELQTVVSSPKATQVVDGLEAKYGVDLASTVIRIMIKDIPWPGVVDFLVREHNLTPAKAQELQRELLANLFFNTKEYLGIQVEPGGVAKINNKPAPQNLPTENNQNKVDNLDEVALLAGIKTAEEKTRLESIVAIFKKGVRDSIGTIDALIKPFANGGLSLNKEQAEKVVNLISGITKKEPVAPKMNKPKTPLEKLDYVQDADYDLGALAKKVGKSKTFSKEELKHELAPPPPVVTQKQPAKNLTQIKNSFTKIKDKFVKKKDNNIKQSFLEEPVIHENKNSVQAKVELKTTAVKNEKPAISNDVDINKQDARNKTNEISRPIVERTDPTKPQVNDIIKPTTRRIQGPVEELANMDLINFNRIGDDPQMIINTIKSKIDLLEQESYTKRQQGINAWRRSPVYTMYLSLGEQSIHEGKPIETIIKEKIDQGKMILTYKQFQTIGELNGKLKV